MSVSASPEMTRKRSSPSNGSASFTAPAVPSGVSSTTYAIETPMLGAVAEVVFDLVGEIVQGRDDLGDAVAPQQVDDVMHHRLVGDRRERLGQTRGQRTQP